MIDAAISHITSQLNQFLRRSFDLTEDEAREAIEAAERETGLPATDVIRFGADKLVDVIERMDNDKHGRPE